MDIFECIKTKRSVRTYEDKCISNEDMDKLIELGTMASTGSGMEPWGFVVLNNKEEINQWSEKIKAHLLENTKYSVFNHANTLLIIYGDKNSHWRTYDCSLAAGNIMLAAHEMGIGTCWIGFAEYMLNTDEFKQKYNIPENFELICPMSIGYMKKRLDQPKRKKPTIFYR